MIFRRPKSYSITLKRAHELLKIPKSSNTTAMGDEIINNRPSREKIQSAFRTAAKLHHPDLIRSTINPKIKMNDTNTTFRECHEARELLLDYYIRRKYVRPEILQSAKDKPPSDYMEEGSCHQY